MCPIVGIRWCEGIGVLVAGCGCLSAFPWLPDSLVFTLRFLVALMHFPDRELIRRNPCVFVTFWTMEQPHIITCGNKL